MTNWQRLQQTQQHGKERDQDQQPPFDKTRQPERQIALQERTARFEVPDAFVGDRKLVYVLLDAARSAHGGEDYFTPLGTFPNLHTDEFPISDESVRYFKIGPSVPAALSAVLAGEFYRKAVADPGPVPCRAAGSVAALPRMAEGRIKKRLVIWYREIKSLEDETWKNRQPSAKQIAQWLGYIDTIDAHANEIRMPQRYFQDVYALKQAIGVVRERIHQVAGKAQAADSRAVKKAVLAGDPKSIR